MVFPVLYDPADLPLPAVTDNAGGLRKLRLIPAGQVELIKPERFPHPARLGYPEYTVSAQHLILAPGSSLVDVEVYPGYSSFTDDMDVTDNGELFRPTIQLLIPKVRPDVVIWVQRYRAVRWLAFLEDRNGFSRLVGTPDYGLALAATFGQTMGKGANQTVLTFTAASTQPAYFLTGVTDADLISSGPFSEAFGFAFQS